MFLFEACVCETLMVNNNSEHITLRLLHLVLIGGGNYLLALLQLRILRYIADVTVGL